MRPNRCLFRLASAILVLGIVTTAAFAQDGAVGFRLNTEAATPLGPDSDVFGFGGKADVLFAVESGGGSGFVGAAGAEYGLSALGIDTTLSLLGGGATIGYQTELNDTIWFEATGGGGYYLGLLNNGTGPRVGGGFVRGGAAAYIALTPGLSIGLAADYRNYLGLGQFLTVGLSTALRLQPRTTEVIVPQQVAPQPVSSGPVVLAPRPLDEAQNAELLQIDQAEFVEVFPVFFKYYDTHPIGSARVTNVGESTITDLKMSTYVEDYMSNPTACTVPNTLAPGESAAIEIRSFFNEQVLRIEEGTKVSAELAVSFAVDEIEHQRTYTQVVRLHNRNNMTWDDFNKPAAYVTAFDTSVLTFARQVAGIVSEDAGIDVSPDLRKVMALHTAVDLFNMTYAQDPSSPYRRRSEEQELEIDYLQFPRQTLAYKSGDCDDLSILYCAMLESLGIPSATILVPGHIFVAFSLGMTPDAARDQFARAEDLIFRDNETWLPLEVTSISDGFMTAWQTGARQWREHVAREQADFVVTRDAWEIYEPVGLPSVEQGVTPPAESELLVAYREQLTDFVDQTIYPLVAEIQAVIAERGRRPALVNRLAILYARYGLYDRARRELERLVEEHGDYAPALSNLGNISFQEGNLNDAIRQYERALVIKPKDPVTLLNLARASHELENYGTADRSFAQVRELDPDLADRFSYLDLRGDAAARAAAVGNLRNVNVWVEDEE